MNIKRESLICDANILIDFCTVDKTIIKKLSANLFSIYIPDLILSEVNNLNVSESQELGFKILETPITLLKQANILHIGCSIQDTICYLQAESNYYSLATNDKKLR